MITINNSLGKPNSQELYCAVINQPVKATEWRPLIIPGGQAIWGRCPACWGWHVMVGPEVEPRLALVGQEIFSPAL